MIFTWRALRNDSRGASGYGAVVCNRRSRRQAPQLAVRELRQLNDERWNVAVAYPTLLEAYGLILFRVGKNAASNWLVDVADTSLINPIPKDYRQAAAKVRAFADQPITLFDAVVAVLAPRLGLEIWSNDHHFDVMRVGAWR
jgi:predicted nucleic acid-binding protein